MTAQQERTAKVPPRVFVRIAWRLHRALLRFSGGRIGLRPPGKAFGMLRLTTVELNDGLRAVRGRAAEGEERDRLWARWGEFSDNYDAWAAMRSGETAVVVLEPRAAAAVTA